MSQANGPQRIQVALVQNKIQYKSAADHMDVGLGPTAAPPHSQQLTGKRRRYFLLGASIVWFSKFQATDFFKRGIQYSLPPPGHRQHGEHRGLVGIAPLRHIHRLPVHAPPPGPRRGAVWSSGGDPGDRFCGPGNESARPLLPLETRRAYAGLSQQTASRSGTGVKSGNGV